jgi:hypothetical protein
MESQGQNMIYEKFIIRFLEMSGSLPFVVSFFV